MREQLAREKARGVRWLVLDVDGVLTDGRILLDGQEGEWKAFDARDGHRIVLAAGGGIRTVFLTGRSSRVVARRPAELGVQRVFQGALDKGAVMREFLEAEKIVPQPDSPTRPSVSPGRIVSDTPSTALTEATWRRKTPPVTG